MSVTRQQIWARLTEPNPADRGAAVVAVLPVLADWARPGSGVLQANALRMLRGAGVLDAVRAAGYAFDNTGVRLADATGRLVAELTEGRFDPDLPAAVGIARSVLTRILHKRAVELGATLRLGTKITDLCPATGKVALTTEDEGSDDTRSFDLVVGADGVNSTVRRPIRCPGS